MACPAIDDGAFLASVLAHVDCQAATLGEGGWRALSGGGVLLPTALTLFIAFFGYRLLLGERLAVRDGVTAAMKVGVVLLLATSWPAFRTVVYDVALRGPAELAATIGAPSGLPGSDGSLGARLQGVDDMLGELAVIGSGRPPGAVPVSGPSTAQSPEDQAAELQRLQRQAQRRPWDPAREYSLIDTARLLFLAATLGAVASVRLLAGLLLALAPLFALFLLFDRTRGLFEGWVRGLAGAALAMLATGIVLGVQLALVEPWLAQVIALRRADIATPAVPVELAALALVFAIVLVAVLIGAGKVARGFRFPADVAVAAVGRAAGDGAQPRMAGGPVGQSAAVAAAAGRSRAMGIADAVARTQRHEATTAMGAGGGATGGGPDRRVNPVMRAGGDVAPASAVPLGRSFQRRTHGRVSALAGRRDSR